MDDFSGNVSFEIHQMYSALRYGSLEEALSLAAEIGQHSEPIVWDDALDVAMGGSDRPTER
jgi:hypothetical protein